MQDTPPEQDTADENALLEALIALHDGLPRLGPGDNAATLKALACCNGLPRQAVVADIGCGTGAQTLQLARTLHGTLLAFDMYENFLHSLQQNTRQNDTAAHVIPVQADMHALPLTAESLDLCWSEGAMYLMGFATALKTWRNFLRPAGWLCVTELSWLQSNIPTPCKTWWNTNYPAMQTVTDNIQTAQECGFVCKEHFTLTPQAWTNYYDPLHKRLAAFSAARQDTAAQTVAHQTQAEREIFTRYSRYYGYEFYIFQRS